MVNHHKTSYNGTNFIMSIVKVFFLKAGHLKEWHLKKSIDIGQCISVI